MRGREGGDSRAGCDGGIGTPLEPSERNRRNPGASVSGNHPGSSPERPNRAQSYTIGGLAKAVKAALLHPKGAGLSDSQIAEHVGVNDKTVGRYRAELEATSELPKIDTRTVKRGDQEYKIDTANIGGPAREFYDEAAKERQKRKPADSVPVKLPEQKSDSRDAAGKADPLFMRPTSGLPLFRRLGLLFLLAGSPEVAPKNTILLGHKRSLA